VERARSMLDNPAFTTDVIVGFPGETDAFFEESYAFCQTVGFSQMHIFTYSPRPKTIAARMSNQVNGAVATERSERLRELGKSMALDYHRRFIGQEIEVLVEQSKGGLATGYSKHYIPVEFPAEGNLRKQIVSVVADRASLTGISAVNSL